MALVQWLSANSISDDFHHRNIGRITLALAKQFPAINATVS